MSTTALNDLPAIEASEVLRTFYAESLGALERFQVTESNVLLDAVNDLASEILDELRVSPLTPKSMDTATVAERIRFRLDLAIGAIEDLRPWDPARSHALMRRLTDTTCVVIVRFRRLLDQMQYGAKISEAN